MEYHFFGGKPLAFYYTDVSANVNIVSGIVIMKQSDTWYFMIAKLQKYYTVTIKFEIVYF